MARTTCFLPQLGCSLGLEFSFASSVSINPFPILEGSCSSGPAWAKNFCARAVTPSHLCAPAACLATVRKLAFPRRAKETSPQRRVSGLYNSFPYLNS